MKNSLNNILKAVLLTLHLTACQKQINNYMYSEGFCLSEEGSSYEQADNCINSEDHPTLEISSFNIDGSNGLEDNSPLEEGSKNLTLQEKVFYEKLQNICETSYKIAESGRGSFDNIETVESLLKDGLNRYPNLLNKKIKIKIKINDFRCYSLSCFVWALLFWDLRLIEIVVTNLHKNPRPICDCNLVLFFFLKFLERKYINMRMNRFVFATIDSKRLELIIQATKLDQLGFDINYRCLKEDFGVLSNDKNIFEESILVQKSFEFFKIVFNCYKVNEGISEYTRRRAFKAITFRQAKIKNMQENSLYGTFNLEDYDFSETNLKLELLVRYLLLQDGISYVYQNYSAHLSSDELKCAKKILTKFVRNIKREYINLMHNWVRAELGERHKFPISDIGSIILYHLIGKCESSRIS